MNPVFAPWDGIGPPAVPPFEFASAFDAVAPGLVPLAETQRTEGESWISTIERLLPVIAATKLQRDIINLQLERAKQGLAPVDMAEYGVGVNVGVDKQTLYIVGGIAVLLALAIFASKR